MQQTYLILHDIRSVYNVGAIFRTADAVGVSKIFCTGITPGPLDRFGRVRKDFAKTALGAHETVPWENTTVSKAFQFLKKNGVQIIALEQSPGSVDYKEVVPGFPSAVLVGSETEGLSQALLSKADVIAEIPMHGAKESLNVSVALGIVLFRWFDLA